MVDDFEGALSAAAGSTTLGPDERVKALRRVRSDIEGRLEKEPPGTLTHRDLGTLVGHADTYIGSAELEREARSLDGALERVAVAELADVRDEMETQGRDMSQSGIYSHAELDELEEDGVLAEAVLGRGFGLALNPALAAKVARNRRRGPGGKFADEFGSPPEPKGRGGKALPGVKKPPTQRSPEAAPEPPASPGTDIAAQLAEVRQYGLNDWPTKGELAQRILGDAKDTQELHTRPLPASPGTKGQGQIRAYTKERKAVHDHVIGAALGGPVAKLLGAEHPVARKLRAGEPLEELDRTTIRSAAAAARGRDVRPKALFMAGGPASGKTSALRASPELEPDASVVINPDDLKAALPEYGQMVEGKEKYAAMGTHEESSDLGKRLQSEVMDLGLNVVVDGTGDSKPGKFAGKMKDMDEAGYDVSALYVTIPTDAAVVRATRRAMKSGRWVPEPELRAQHKNVSANFGEVSSLPFLKGLKLYDNSGESPVLIADGSAGTLNVADQAAFDSFVAKEKESA